MKLFIYYIVLINIITFASMGIDKYKAKKKKWRIPEKNLMTLAVLGGSIGMLFGIYFFRHKTKHKLFTLGTPVILLLQVIIIYLYFY
ncbi:Uncharacterized membrane protein YsdA, DUF1294 family [Clostridium sp. DSM 8431]|uniref:DUF1294 domain-containing protein n=1 Tax=Clostridium sp. DSM 8431 TaxID=1761781 RepID=UPI0008ECA3DF|nr:DUF1294 domain-containing protein [Clostridium sp. DSM 8431]SFU84017.1 Uncharacterized membrane protein YsdA, DUF1294 family [Clostridium sp. DSM 8431]